MTHQHGSISTYYHRRFLNMLKLPTWKQNAETVEASCHLEGVAFRTSERPGRCSLSQCYLGQSQMMKMQKQKASSYSGLQRYQIQHHKGLIRSLELEHRYNQKQLEQQQRQFLSSLSKLSLGLIHFSSQGMRSKTSCASILPVLKDTPSINGEMNSPRIKQQALLEKRDRVNREPLDPLMESLYGEETTDKPQKLTADDKPTWDTLTFADIKQRHSARIQALQPYMFRQHQLLSPQGFPGTRSPWMERMSRRHGFYSPQLSGVSSNKAHRVSIYTGKK
ncbi:hypothetical protein AOLI_G00122670 [Acnodon oligacanthus]